MLFKHRAYMKQLGDTFGSPETNHTEVPRFYGPPGKGLHPWAPKSPVPDSSWSSVASVVLVSWPPTTTPWRCCPCPTRWSWPTPARCWRPWRPASSWERPGIAWTFWAAPCASQAGAGCLDFWFLCEAFPGMVISYDQWYQFRRIHTTNLQPDATELATKGFRLVQVRAKPSNDLNFFCYKLSTSTILHSFPILRTQWSPPLERTSLYYHPLSWTSQPGVMMIGKPPILFHLVGLKDEATELSPLGLLAASTAALCATCVYLIIRILKDRQMQDGICGYSWEMLRDFW